MNHSRKEIEVVGSGDDKHQDKLLELVVSNDWNLMDDDIEMVNITDPQVPEMLRCLVEVDGYMLADEDWFALCPDHDPRFHAAYAAEVERLEIERDNNRHGDRGWSGWDTEGATCDV